MKKHISIIFFLAILCMLPVKAAASAALKISVDTDGIYHISFSDLQHAGYNPDTIDPQTIMITNKGKEIPVYVYGEEDGSFDPIDYIEFYGTAISRGSSRFEFTASNVYWLTSGGLQGLRMMAKDGTPSGAFTVPTSFGAGTHVEADNYYWQTIPNGEGKDHWFWGDRINALSSNSYTIVLNNIYSSAFDADVRVNLQGRTGTGTSPDHHTRIYLNGSLIDDQHWDGQVQFLHEVTVPHSYLVNGTNTITLNSVGDTGSSVDTIHMDWIEIDYYDTFVAENNSLDFTATGTGTFEFKISGFTSGTVAVFDITASNNVRRVINNTTQQIGPTYTTRFEDSLTGSARYLALSASQKKTPADIKMDTPSSLKKTSNGADYIIITYDGFYNNILPLAGFYQNKGLRVITAKATDIYDEFSYGIFDPRAIKDFLSYAYHSWVSPAPLYVLLVGDASMDQKDNFGMGNMNYVPTHWFDTYSLGQTPGDNWFVCVSGADILPDMFIGRLSVRAGSEVDNVVAKIIGYQSTQASGWNTNALFVADNDMIEFEQISDTLAANYLPAGYTSKKVYMSQYSSASAAKSAIKTNINNGALITNYTGHGAVDNWAGENMFVTSDVSTLSNSGKLTFVTILNCLNGFFPMPLTPWKPSIDRTCLAEGFLLEPNNGSIAVFAPTGLGYPWEHSMLAQELFSAIFNEGKSILGEATTQAKIGAFSNGVSGDIVETFVLLGDPATGLNTGLNISDPPNGTIDTPTGDVTLGKGQSVYFTGTGTDPDGTVASYLWNFDGGALNSTEEDPGDVTFNAPDIYTITFTVTDNDGLSDPTPATRTITVLNISDPPNGTIDTPIGDVTLGKGQSVHFTGTGTDTNGTVASYIWNFDGGALNSTKEDPGDVTFNAPGIYTITFTVTDNDGLTDPTPDTRTITVNALPSNPPTADAGGPYSGIEGQSITFDGSGSTDSDGNIVFYDWDFGDAGFAAAGISLTRIYFQQGAYTVTLTVTDQDGATDTASTIATVSDTIPIAGFSGSPTIGVAPLTVVFTDSSTAYDGISSWTWGFGDGGTSDLQAPDHTYNTEGVYTVYLTVTDSDGSSDTLTRSKYITVLGDTDSDGDGISDNEEGAGDLDNDGTPDCLDADTARISAAAGGGEISLDIDEGANKGARFSSVEVMGDDDPSLSQDGKPDVNFKHGLVKFTIHGLASGDSLKLTITYSAGIPFNAEYWKYDPGNGWYQIAFGSNDGDNVITITLIDGGTGDGDETANGTISDPGGIGIPRSGDGDSDGSSGGGGGGCFITTAAHGF
ncbi:MAG: PKD domain-containing protein [Desulfobacteraceae bacterium]|nr:PKD domain-containing protein [Desulfobacteraceae bacterium]MBC2757474.1 PKD domain-containing protein [Desulfobacteraceae bacterium]